MKVLNQADVKQKNKNLLLKLIIANAPISRIELAKLTGLTKMTVTNLVTELIEESLIEEAGLTTQTSLGRKPIGLEIRKNAAVILGIYIARGVVHTFAGDLSGDILFISRREFHQATNQSLLNTIAELMDATIQEVSGHRIIGMGISSVGPLDVKRGVILNPPNFYAVHDLDLVFFLKDRYATEVYLDNDMNTAALAEKYYGKARKLKNFIYMGVTNGIGAGIIIGNKLYAGDQGFSGEVGHITVNLDGPKCSCGNNGCLELYATLPHNFREIPLQQQNKKIDEISRYLAAGIVTLINLFDPEEVFLGHDIAMNGEYASSVLNQLVKGRYLSSENKEVRVAASEFLDKSPVKGAIALCTERYFQS